MKKILSILVVILPWKIKRLIYIKVFKYKIAPSARIGFSIIFPKMLIMENNSKIGSLTYCKGIDLVHLEESSKIGTLNWITGFPSNNSQTGHFSYDKNRFPALIIKKHSAITSRHMIDCTNTITIGEFTTVAGIRSQLLTHSINIFNSRQESLPINIGNYCFISTSVICLGGTTIPDYSVVGALSLCNKKYEDCYSLYGGVPAKKIKDLGKDTKYFNREVGYVI